MQTKIAERISNLILDELKHYKIITPDIFNELYQKLSVPFITENDNISVFYSQLEENIISQTESLITNIDKSVVAVDNKDGLLLDKYKLSFIRSKSELESMKKDLYTDTVTGLRNKRWFYHKYTNNNKFNLDGYIILIDIINFKIINSIFGYDMGDRVLLYLTHLLSKIENIELIKYVSDEFIIIYQGTSFEKVLEKLEKIKKSLDGKVLTKNKHKLEGPGSTINFNYSYVTVKNNTLINNTLLKLSNDLDLLNKI